ncbi:hypothetical protein WH35_02170 [Wolbachia endosymbiont of Drosophila incompta]|nr:hypothetical protein WH35_02170 [Wolbachia endosymbiont of Drosophila incompta]
MLTNSVSNPDCILKRSKDYNKQRSDTVCAPRIVEIPVSAACIAFIYKKIVMQETLLGYLI